MIVYIILEEDANNEVTVDSVYENKDKAYMARDVLNDNAVGSSKYWVAQREVDES